MTAPWLTVIIPTYNGAEYLPSALDSIIAQNDPDIEVIAVDDGSTDESLSILESYVTRLPLEVHQRRIGNWAANTNFGLDRAHGQWTCFLHQDDYWKPNRLNAVREALGETDATLLLTAADFVTATGRRVGTWRCPLAPGPRGNSPERVAERLLIQNFVPLPGAVIRTADARAIGGLDPQLWYTPDWDFWLTLTARDRVFYLSQPTACFRLHPESQTVTRSGGRDEFRRQMEFVFERHWPAWESRIVKPKQIESEARLSIDVNVLLAGMKHSRWKFDDFRLVAAALRTGPAGWAHYLHASRILERAFSRFRCGLAFGGRE